MVCEPCEDCTVISKHTHTDRACRPCTFKDVVSQVSDARCGLKKCLPALKYDVQNEMVCDLNVDGSTVRIIDFMAGNIQTKLQALYAGRYWKAMWKDVVGLVSQVCSCVVLRTVSVHKWIPFSQHIMRKQAAVIMQHVANVQEPGAVVSGDDTLWNQAPAGTLVYHSDVALDEVDRIMARYRDLQTDAPRTQSVRNTMSLFPAVGTGVPSDTARVFELTFSLRAVDVLLLKSIDLVFAHPSAPGSPTRAAETHNVTLSAPDNITAARTVLVVHSNIKTLGYLSDATLHAVVSHDMEVGLQVYDGTGQTWVRTRISLRADRGKKVFACTLEQHGQNAFEITTPHDFDLVYTAFQPQMCTSDFGV